MADNARIAVEKLNNRNYQTWKLKMELVLTKEELWDVVNDERPVNPDAAWLKRDGKARATIGLLVEDSQLQQVKREVSAKGAWEALRRHHERDTISSKVFLLKRLSRLKYDENDSMEDHLNNLLQIVDELAALGEELKDNLIVAFILCSLPESYDTLVTALETRPEKDLTTELVKSKLMQEYQRRRETQASSLKEETALQISKASLQARSQSKEIVCYHCHKPGHLKRDCRKWKAQKKNKHIHQAHQVTGDNLVKYDVNVKKREEEVTDYFCFTVNEQMQVKDWYVDSGATSHMTSNRNFFSTIDKASREKVCLANGDMLKVEGIGEGMLYCQTDDRPLKIIIKDVLFVPKLNGSLLSVKKLTEKGFKVNFEERLCEITKNGRIVAKAYAEGGLYKLQCDEKALKAIAIENHDNCIHLWHRRFGHRNPQSVQCLNDNELVEGMTMRKCEIKMVCEPCIKGKLARKPFIKTSKERSQDVLDLVHSDVCGPMQTLTPSRNRYFFSLIDDFSGYTVVYLLKTKDEVFSKLKEYVRFTENKFGRKIKCLRSDRGGEYMNREVEKFLKQEGIMHQKTVPYSPQQNGVAERKNRTLTEAARCMLVDADMANQYWGEAVITANYLQNRLPTYGREITPYELWHNRKPNVRHLRVFGCRAYALVPNETRKKWDEKARQYKFVGYEPGTKGYRLLDEKTNKIIISRDVQFIEFPREDWVSKTWSSSSDTVANGGSCAMSSNNEVEIANVPRDGVAIENESQEDPERESLLRRSERLNKGVPPQRYSANLVSTGEETDDQPYTDDPRNVNEALTGPDADQWRKAMDEEMQSLTKNKTWSLVELPSDKSAVGCKWIFKKKIDSHGNISKYKARLVAQGYSQKYGDYDEIFAPVVKQTTIKCLLAVAAKREMSVKHFDIKTAFLNGNLQEEIYMKQPEMYEQQESDKNMVCRLHKSIYGLKQSARAWYERIDSELTKDGFKRGQADPCLYSKQTNSSWTYILLYVDDIIVASINIEEIENTARMLREHFDLVDLGDLRYYLGLEIERDAEGAYYMHQRSYINKILKRFRMEDAKVSNIPMDPGYLKTVNTTEKLSNNNNFRQLIGALLYISTNTRPDIALAVSLLSRHVSNPEQEDWIEAKRVLRYLKGTQSAKLLVGNTTEESQSILVCFADADWGGDKEDRKSNTGYVFKYNGGTINWASRKQSIVTLSSTEAEYVAMCEAAQELQWLIQLFQDFNEPLEKPVTIFEDNQSCLKLLDSEKITTRSKHIDIKYHYVKDLKKQGIIECVYCPSAEMTADILTKPCEMIKTKRFREMLGLKLSA